METTKDHMQYRIVTKMAKERHIEKVGFGCFHQAELRMISRSSFKLLDLLKEIYNKMNILFTSSIMYF